MRISKFLGATLCVAAMFWGQATFGATVNGDIEGDSPNDTTYSGADGILSSAGGTTWNSIEHFVDAANLVDEFGAATGIGVTWLPGDFGAIVDGASTNELQDSGTSGEGFDIIGLQAGGVYDLAIYAMENAGGCVTGAGGQSCGFWTIAGPPTYVLPGVEGRDYALYTGLVPFDLGGGVLGLRIDGLDGSITGFQLSTPIPVPAAVWLFASAAGLLGFRRRA